MGSGTLVAATSGRQPGGLTHPEERACSFGFRAFRAGAARRPSLGTSAGCGELVKGSAEPGIGRRVVSGLEVMVRRPGLEPGTG